MISASRWGFLGFVFLLAAPVLRGADAPPARAFGGLTPLQWSVRMADSEIVRRGDALSWREGGRTNWDYAAALFDLSLIKLSESTGNTGYFKFAEHALGSFIMPDGGIRGYRAADYTLDNINGGKVLLALYQATHEERYRKAAALLRKQLDTQPRTSEGGFWHKQRYPHQMWLDGLYMAGPFYAEYNVIFERSDNAFDDVAKQFRLAGTHTYDPATGLFYHGWDESKSQPWANPATGCSSNFWGRAIGWYGMAMVDVLDYLPTNHPARAEIVGRLQNYGMDVCNFEDRDTGLWYQVMDQGGRKGNYLEATASCMFVYTFAKGVRLHHLPGQFAHVATNAYAGIIKDFVKTDGQNRISLTQCCSVAGLGFGRSGSFDYYIGEPVVSNDLKGVGPFILAGIELQKLSGPQ